MNSLKIYIEPDEHRPPQDDGPDEHLATLVVPCGTCGSPNSFHPQELITRSRQWLKTLDAHQIAAIEQAFDCSASKSKHYVYLHHFKQQAYCAIVSCKSCGERFVTCMQFYERQPTRYITKLIGAAMLDNEEFVDDGAFWSRIKKLENLTFWQYCLVAGIVALIGSSVLAMLAVSAFKFLGIPGLKLSGGDEALGALDVLGYVVLAPLVETLILAWLVDLLGKRNLTDAKICLIVSVAFALLHGLIHPLAFFASVFSFFVFAWSYRRWRRVSWKHGYWAAAIPHIIVNIAAVSSQWIGMPV